MHFVVWRLLGGYDRNCFSSSLAQIGFNSNVFQNSLESKARPSNSTLRGRLLIPVSSISSRTQFAWGPRLLLVIWSDGPKGGLVLSIGADPHAEARSHQSYTRPSVMSHRCPWAFSKSSWTARMARPTSKPWITWRLPYGEWASENDAWVYGS